MSSRREDMRRNSTAILTVALVVACFARTPSLAESAILVLPSGAHPAITHVASPDGSHVLYGIWPKANASCPAQLWIQDRRAHKRTLLQCIAGTLTAMWSPNGAAFATMPRISNQQEAYIYDTASLKRLDIGQKILASDATARRFATDSHTYFEVRNWQDAQDAIVQLHGHTDRSPSRCFDFRYVVSRLGFVQKLSQLVTPAGDPRCRG